MHILYGSDAIGSKQQNWLKQRRRFILGMPQDLEGHTYQGFIEAWNQESATLSAFPWGRLLSVVAPLLRHHLSFMQVTCSLLSLNTCWPRTPEVTLPGVLAPCNNENQYFPIPVPNFLKRTCYCPSWIRYSEIRATSLCPALSDTWLMSSIWALLDLWGPR